MGRINGNGRLMTLATGHLREGGAHVAAVTVVTAGLALW
jgi:hypothetical protein